MGELSSKPVIVLSKLARSSVAEGRLRFKHTNSNQEGCWVTWLLIEGYGIPGVPRVLAEAGRADL